MQNIPTLDMVTSYMSAAVRTVAAKSLPAESLDPAREFLVSPLPTVEQLNNIVSGFRCCGLPMLALHSFTMFQATGL